jgi:hypothetical protein
VFTDYNVVVVFKGAETTTISTNKYIQDLEKKIGNDANGVFYSVNRNTFSITEDNTDFDVVLPDKDEDSLNTKEYTPLVKNLLYLAAKHRKISDEKNKVIVRETKIKAMENSNYEDIEDVEDLELYLDYLRNEALKKAKTTEEKETIQTKIIGIALLIKRKTKEDDNRIPSPLDLKSYIERFVYDVTNKSNKLTRKEKLMILNKTKKIVIDYKKLMDVGFSSNLPISILDRIDEVEDYLDKKLGINSNQLENQLTHIMDELAVYVDEKKPGAK